MSGEQTQNPPLTVENSRLIRLTESSDMDFTNSGSTPRFTLYVAAKSFVCHKVLMTFYEKNEPFIQKYVDPMKRQNLETWYMKLNPNGTLPCLVDGKTIITDPDDIIDYLDSQLLRLPVLVPNLKTEYGQEVCRLRNLLNIEDEILVVGILYNPNSTPTHWRPYNITSEELDAMIDSTICKMQRLAVQYPNLKEAYIAKIPKIATLKTYKDPFVLQNYLEEIQMIFDEVELRLQKTAKDCSSEWFLVGSSFTVADISLCALLRRLTVFGLASQFFTVDVRPFISRYWERMKKRPSFFRLNTFIKTYGVNA